MGGFTDRLSPELRELRPVRVLERSLQHGRLAHGILLHGPNLTILKEVAYALASTLHDCEPHEVRKRQDFHELAPSGKSRVIDVESVRDLISSLSLTSLSGDWKVAVICEVDRMNVQASNAFLKTLEEPSAKTLLLLLTTRPYDLLTTIRSRTFNFRVPAEGERLPGEEWMQWRTDLKAWLASVHSLVTRRASRQDTSAILMDLYALAARFNSVVEALGEEVWEAEREEIEQEGSQDSLGDLMPDERSRLLKAQSEALEALEAGVKRGLRLRLLAEMEETLRAFALAHGAEFGSFPSGQLLRSVELVERSSGLLALNLKEDSVIEQLLLGFLRIWSERPA